MIVFAAPVVLGLFIYLIRGFLDFTDAIILLAVFSIMFVWQKYLFSKER